MVFGLFLQHGGGSVYVPGSAPAGGSPLAGIVIILLLVIAIAGLWFFLARKKRI